MRRTFLFNEERCVACQVCTVACKDWNGVNPGAVRWRKQVTHETDTNPHFHPLSMSCNHCFEPACLPVCPSAAIIKRASDGVVYVDRDKCTNALSCITACPFAEPQIADNIQEPTEDNELWKDNGWLVAHPMQKCDFCRERIDNGMRPTCVDACIANAIEMGDYDDFMVKYPNAKPLNEADFPWAYAIKNTADTRPSFLINPRKPLIITEDVEIVD